MQLEQQSYTQPQLIATNAHTVAQSASTAATNIYTVAAGRATIASRGLGMAMSLLGGPVGLIMTAGIALTYFLSESEKTTEETKKLKVHVYELGGAFDSIANKKALTQLKENRAEIQKTTDEISAQYSKVADLKRRQKNTKGTRFDSLYQGRIDRVELEIQALTKTRAELMKTSAEIANFQNDLDGLKWTNPDAGIPDHIKKLQESLKSDEEKLKAHYEKRKQMVIAARNEDAINESKYDAILKQLKTQYYTDINTIVKRKEADKTRIQNQAEEKRKNDLQRDLENRIAVVKGFAGREALAAYNNELSVEQARQQARVDAKRRAQIGLAANDDAGELEYNADSQIKDLERQTELNAANGYYSQREADEAAHQERLMQIKTRHTGALQSNVLAFANFEKQTETEKASAIVGLGAATFKTMAGQSKTAFKAYKAFAIAQAVINTYQGATAAFTSLASIPIIGPVLGGVAAAGAVMSGLQQVRQIKAQQPAGIAHGGLDYVPNESTYVLQRGERVLSPKQNTEISQMARRYNGGGAANDAGSGGVSISITNQITVQGSTNEQNSQAVGQDIARQVVGVVVANIQENGSIIRAVRGAA